MADAVERARTSEPFGMRQRRRRQAQLTHARVEPGQIDRRAAVAGGTRGVDFADRFDDIL